MSRSKSPALAIRPVQEAAGHGMVRDLPGNGIVVERLSHDATDVGELNQLGQRAADVERGEGLTFPLTGVDPLAVMIDATRKSPGRLLEPVLLVENRRARIPGIGRVDAPLRTDEQSTEAPDAMAMQQVLGRPHRFTARDRQFHRWEIPPGGHLELDARCAWIAFHIYTGGPTADPDGEAQMLVTALNYDNHLGQIAIGRISRGMISKGDPLVLLDKTGNPIPCRADYVFSFRDLGRHEVEKVVAGDIAAIAGVKGVTIGDTLASPLAPQPLERISIEKPTVKMTFGVNTSPFSGKDGKYATSRVLWDRLQRELQTNVSLRVERTDSADEFTVSGRGELHLSVLIENMRREGMEFQVSKPEAIITIIDGSSYEPYERIFIDTPQEFVGALTEELASRMGQVEDMQNEGNGNIRVVYVLPTRGLIGFRSFFLRATRGSGTMTSELLQPRRVHGEMRSTRFGAVVASETGVALSYGIRAAQERGQTFIDPNIAPGQKDRFWEPWPYVEGLSMPEAMHNLAFIAIGMYGHELNPQNGAPIRLVVPWKYGFKSIKSINTIEFVKDPPRTFWQTVSPLDYDFWANVEPTVPYAKWDQRFEIPLGSVKKETTMLYNGYAAQVRKLYS